MRKLAPLTSMLLLVGTAGLALAENPVPLSKALPQTIVRTGIKNSRVVIVKNRIQKQMKRIHEGIRSKQLTHEKAKDLMAKVDAVRNQLKAMLQPGGKTELTADQLKQLNQMLDDNSTAIFGEKHGDNTTP
jgi:hypothetical protein